MGWLFSYGLTYKWLSLKEMNFVTGRWLSRRLDPGAVWIAQNSYIALAGDGLLNLQRP
jgi:hypothetical protein